MNIVSVLIQHHVGPTGNVLVVKGETGAWEFPSVRIRTNETPKKAVIRLCHEQLHMVVRPGNLIMIGRHKPSDGYVEHLAEGNITHNTHTKDDYHSYYEGINVWQTEPETQAEYQWIPAPCLGELTFAGDDEKFMAKYDPYVNPKYIPDIRMY